MSDDTETSPGLPAIIDPAGVPDIIINNPKGITYGPGISIGGDKVCLSTEHLNEDQKLLVRWLHSHARNNNWDWSRLAEETKIDKTAAYRMFTDTYRYPEWEYSTVVEDGKKVRKQFPHPRSRQRIALDGLCEKIARYKSLVDQRQSVFSAGFVQTSVWQKVEWVCRQALKRQKIGLIYGESQIGKTTCLKEFARLNNHGQTIYFEVPPTGGVHTMIKALARALHVSTNQPHDKLLELVMNALDGSKLLLVDEVHRIFSTFQKASVMRCLDTLRYIHDNTGCGMILSGTNAFRTALNEGEFFQYLKQLQRRSLYPVQLPMSPPREDLDKICAAYGLSPARGEAEETLLFLAKRDGFGMVCTRLTDAHELATKARQPLDWKHFLKAYHIIRKLGIEETEAA